MAQKIQGLHNDLAAVERRIAEVKGRRAYVVRAPTTGRALGTRGKGFRDIRR